VDTHFNRFPEPKKKRYNKKSWGDDSIHSLILSIICIKNIHQSSEKGFLVRRTFLFFTPDLANYMFNITMILIWFWLNFKLLLVQSIVVTVFLFRHYVVQLHLLLLLSWFSVSWYNPFLGRFTLFDLWLLSRLYHCFT
jgi:hypothetical protein